MSWVLFCSAWWAGVQFLLVWFTVWILTKSGVGLACLESLSFPPIGCPESPFSSDNSRIESTMLPPKVYIIISIEDCLLEFLLLILWIEVISYKDCFQWILVLNPSSDLSDLSGLSSSLYTYRSSYKHHMLHNDNIIHSAIFSLLWRAG